MSYITMSDLGRRGRGRRGGGRRWRGGGGGYYPWYYDTPVYAEPLVVMDPVDPQDELEVEKAKEAAALLKEAAEKEKIKAIAAAVSAELAKGKGLGQGGIYIDVMGPGAREDEIDVVAKDTDVIDEFVSSQDALRFRQEAGTVDITPRAPGMSGFGMTYFDTSMGDDPPPAPTPAAALAAKGRARGARAGGRGGIGGMLRRCATAAAVSVAVGAAVGYMLGSSKKA